METASQRLPLWIHHTLVPLLLLTLCPPTVFFFWYINTTLHGSIEALFTLFQQQGFFSTLFSIWSPVALGSPTAWKILALFASFQLVLMKVLPGKPFLGPVTPKGNIPIYKANGVPAFFITLATFLATSSYGLGYFPASILYDNMGYLLGALNVFSLGFCLFLYLKGIYAPSSSDAGASGNPLFDYYWGTELYPRIFGWDVKMFTNCRFGMMGWPLLLLSYAAKQEELYGEISNGMMISLLLQLFYVGKFFFWETGYLRSLDIMHDRAGFYICWGCLVWLPCIYTSPTLYLVQHPYNFTPFWGLLLFSVGAGFVLINFLADLQRQKVRAKNGNCTVWRRRPLLIPATYQTEGGETKETLLLASGWWGLSRHFHYIPEILAALCWSLPALFYCFIPYFYVIYLTILLLDRAFRHDRRCADKYGASWEQYCHKVPYKIIPYLF